MFAVLKTGGKQYRVRQGDVLRVEKLAATAGETVQFNDVLMVGSTVGTPLVEGAGVQAEVIDQIKGEKLIHYVRRRRKHSSARKKGHRQHLTLLRVTEILEKGADGTGVKAAVGAAGSDTAASPAPKPTKAPSKSSPKAADAKAAASPAEGSADDLPGTKPGNLLDAARDGGADDLKKISGVGPKLEKLLNDNGVFHFDQIAAWTDDEIAYMDEKLSFKGRIARDGWIDQAKDFAAGKEQE
jgi:large subunit ribosomal protein L21